MSIPLDWCIYCGDEQKQCTCESELRGSPSPDNSGGEDDSGSESESTLSAHKFNKEIDCECGHFFESLYGKRWVRDTDSHVDGRGCRSREFVERRLRRAGLWDKILSRSLYQPCTSYQPFGIYPRTCHYCFENMPEYGSKICLKQKAVPTEWYGCSRKGKKEYTRPLIYHPMRNEK